MDPDRFWAIESIFVLSPSILFILYAKYVTEKLRKSFLTSLSDQSNKIAVLRRPNENQDAKQPPKFERNYEKIKSYGLVKTKTRQNFLSSQPEAEYVFVWTEKLRKLFVLQLSVRMIIEITFLVLYFMIQAEQHNEKLTVRKKHKLPCT